MTKQLNELLEEFEFLKTRMDAMQEELVQKRNDIASAMKIEQQESFSAKLVSGRTWSVKFSSRTTETVTREGKSFIKVHATPELLNCLITTRTSEILTIKEKLVTGHELSDTLREDKLAD